MKTIGELLRTKEHAIWSIGPEATVYEALQRMAEKDVGALLVIDGGKLVGIVSERDCARKVLLKGRFSQGTPVREIMAEQAYYVCPDHTVEECMALMIQRRLRYLPIFDGDRLVGVVSMGDLGKAMLAERKLEVTASAVRKSSASV